MKCPSCKSNVNVTLISASSLDNFFCPSCRSYFDSDRKSVILFYLVLIIVFCGVNVFCHKILGLTLELPKGTLPFFFIPHEGAARSLIAISFSTIFLTEIGFFFIFKKLGGLKIRDGGYLKSSTVITIVTIFLIYFFVQVFSYFGQNLFM